MSDAVLVLNAGSSSIKFSVYSAGRSDAALLTKGQIEGIGVSPRFTARDATGEQLADQRDLPEMGDGHASALVYLGDWLEEHVRNLNLLGVGHRVVHGGTAFTHPVAVNEEVLAALDALVPLAPLHQPHSLAAIRAVATARPGLAQVACFDTAFHRDHPKVADRFALPDPLYQEGVRRYGFHGLSYEYIAHALEETAPELAAGRVVVAHLGSGASMCAMRGGHSIDSTMGFTALDGLPMGTRCGNLDPGVVFYLMREHGRSLDEVEQLLYTGSGLLGISGVSNDMRELTASDAPLAAEAIDYFVHRIHRELGALSASLGGLDALVFTAGIGENAPALRARVCKAAAWLGIDLDEAANDAGESRITRPASRASAWVIPTDEEKMIARHTLGVLRETSRG